MDTTERFLNDLKSLAIDDVDSVAVQLLRYRELLQEWNRLHNLTAITDDEQILTRHFLDCLLILPYIRGPRVLDIGSGAGFPGLPLAIARPQWQLTLLDSNGKKTRFLQHVVATLGLKNTEIAHARGEQFQPTAKFDTLVTRALASLADQLNWCGHLLQGDTELLAMKGQNPAAELKALPTGFEVVAVTPITVPGLGAERCLVRIKKTKK